MKKYMVFLLMAIQFSAAISQIITKKVKYGKSEIDVPPGYAASDEYSLGDSTFSAQWLYLTTEMFQQDVNSQILKQFEGQMQYSTAANVEFISNKAKLSGKKYVLREAGKFKYRILAFGIVDEQPLVLNLGFKEDPQTNKNPDELMKRFIQFKK